MHRFRILFVVGAVSVLLSLVVAMPLAAQDPEVNYTLPGMEEVEVHSVEYFRQGDTPLMMDVYYPPDMAEDAALPAVIFVAGFPDTYAAMMLGTATKDFGQYTSWGRLVAASGLIAVTYNTQNPADDLVTMVAYLRENADSLKVDADRIGFWACSGHVNVTLSYVMQDAGDFVQFGVFYYGPLRIDAAELRRDLPLLVVRAGRDDDRIKDAMETFVGDAISRNVPLTFINFTAGNHGFDGLQDTPEALEIVAQTLDFMHFQFDME